jgi:hypothetical protein
MNEQKLFLSKAVLELMMITMTMVTSVFVPSVVSAQSPSSCYQCPVPDSPLYGPTISLVTQPP